MQAYITRTSELHILLILFINNTKYIMPKVIQFMINGLKLKPALVGCQNSLSILIPGHLELLNSLLGL